MMVAVASLAAYLNTCAPSISADTMRAIVVVESRGFSYAINDNTGRTAYCVPGARIYPCSREQASVVAETLARRGHSIDVGLAQVNSGNFRYYGVTASELLNPCANLRVGSAILASAYLRSITQFPDRRQALRHAILAYNTGSLFAGAPYVQQIVDAALSIGSLPAVPSISLLEPTTVYPATPGQTAHTLGMSSTTRRQQVRPADPRSAPLQARGLGSGSPRGDLNADFQPALSR